jgi:putative inorganic carbon (hco3(-)) transporter
LESGIRHEVFPHLSNRALDKAGRQADRWIFVGLLGLLIWAPLPLGSHRAWAWSLLEVWTFALGVWWTLLYLRGRVELNPVFRNARPFFWLFAGWLLLQLLQLLPLPTAVVGWLSPRALELYTLAHLGTPPAWLPLSVDRFAGVDFLLKSLAYLTLFALSLLLVRTGKRLRITLMTVVLGGVFQALYGGMEALQTQEVARGTFVNRNHLAGWLEIALGLGLGLLMGGLQEGEAVTWRARLRNLFQWMLSSRMRLRVLLALLVVGLVLTRSRMGNAAFFSSLLIVGGVWLLARRGRSLRSAAILLASILIIDIYILGHLFGLEEVVERLRETDAATENRDEVNRDTLYYLRNNPLLGSGGGTFYSNYPQFRGADVGGSYVLYAHNDYLQVAAETGIPGLLLCAAMVLLSLRQALYAIFRRHRPLLRGVGFGSLMGMVSILIHSTVDFNLQIPANAMLFTLLLATAWIAAHHPQQPRGRASHMASPQGSLYWRRPGIEELTPRNPEEEEAWRRWEEEGQAPPWGNEFDHDERKPP